MQSQNDKNLNPASNKMSSTPNPTSAAREGTEKQSRNMKEDIETKNFESGAGDMDELDGLEMDAEDSDTNSWEQSQRSASTSARDFSGSDKPNNGESFNQRQDQTAQKGQDRTSAEHQGRESGTQKNTQAQKRSTSGPDVDSSRESTSGVSYSSVTLFLTS
ncbi:MAG: hypothetical protein EOP06_21850 [Proteobacteria bacterium]|nr:MAG: hypothetical protein EOP06_21850 [Pseudomonadota bacterium]